MSTAESGVRDKIADGLFSYATAVNDRDAVKMGASVYRQVAGEFNALLGPADTCRLAFPTMLVRSDLRQVCLVAVLDDRIVIAWQRGLLRSKTESMVIPLSSITDVAWRRGGTASTRRARLLVISGTPSVTIALPRDGTDAAETVIRTAIAPAPR